MCPTGTIAIETGALQSHTNKLPGERVLINENTVDIENVGSRGAVLEISFDDLVTAKLANGQTPTPALAGDYTAGEFSQSRVDEVMTIEMENNSATSDYIEVDGKYYTVLEESNTAELGDIYLNIDGELGGLKQGSEDRQFEQGSIFSVSYKATACQRSRGAIEDIFGTEVYDALPDSYFED